MSASLTRRQHRRRRDDGARLVCQTLRRRDAILRLVGYFVVSQQQDAAPASHRRCAGDLLVLVVRRLLVLFRVEGGLGRCRRLGRLRYAGGRHRVRRALLLRWVTWLKRTRDLRNRRVLRLQEKFEDIDDAYKCENNFFVTEGSKSPLHVCSHAKHTVGIVARQDARQTQMRTNSVQHNCAAPKQVRQILTPTKTNLNSFLVSENWSDSQRW